MLTPQIQHLDLSSGFDLTAEMRRVMAEEARVRVRGSRRHAIDEGKKLKKDALMTEDGLATFETEVQKLTDQYIKSIDEHTATKEADIMRV